jgi:glutamate dehydrogenase/leucine dehydrogenase
MSTKGDDMQAGLGPFKSVEIFFPLSDFRAFVVVDNIALGPSIGGVRVSPGVTMEEVRRLARTMTLKNSIAGLAHGGGKAGIVMDPRSSEKERCFRLFAQAVKDLHEYIPGPDMGSDETCMAWVFDEIGRAVGLPEGIGGLPLDTLGATGYGLAECAEVACPHAGIEIKGARVAIQGFGSVGKAAARYLTEKGAVVVAVSDSQGSLCYPEGIDIAEMLKVKEQTGSVVNYGKGEAKVCEALFLTSCDILIPAAVPDVIHEDNAEKKQARLVLQGANIPATRKAEEILHRRGILCVPDFIANAGGVIMAAMEYERKSEHEAFDAIAERIRENTRVVLDTAREERVMPRAAAEEIAVRRVRDAMALRRVM